MGTIKELEQTHLKTDYSTLYSKILSGDLTMDEKALVAKILKTIAIKKVDIPYVISSNFHYIDLNEKQINDDF